MTPIVVDDVLDYLITISVRHIDCLVSSRTALSQRYRIGHCSVRLDGILKSADREAMRCGRKECTGHDDFSGVPA